MAPLPCLLSEAKVDSFNLLSLIYYVFTWFYLANALRFIPMQPIHHPRTNSMKTIAIWRLIIYFIYLFHYCYSLLLHICKVWVIHRFANGISFSFLKLIDRAH